MPNCGSFTIRPPFDAAAVAVTACQFSGTFQPGATVDVPITLQNTNPQEATVDVSVVAGGTTLGTATVTVAGNTQSVEKTVTVTLPSTTGTFTLSASVTNAVEASTQFQTATAPRKEGGQSGSRRVGRR